MEIKLTKAEAKRQWVHINDPVDDGVTIGDLYDKYGRDAYIDLEYDYDCTYIYIRSPGRLETDKEYNARIEKILELKRMVAENKAKEKASKEEKERKQYERLKKKFEGK